MTKTFQRLGQLIEQAAQLKTFQGRVCDTAGHGSTRYRSTGHCVACRKQASADWYATNREKAIAYSKARKSANPDARRGAHKEYYRKHAAEYKQRAVQWKKEHPGAVRANKAARRARLLKQRCTCCTAAEIQSVYDAAALCGDGANVDHITPLAVGGLHCVKNLQTLTVEDHKEKTRLDQTTIADHRRR